LASEGVASVDNVPVLGEACQHILDTLLECVDLGVDQNFSDEVFCGELDKALTSSSLLSGRGAVSDGGELRLDVHVVLLDVPGGQSLLKFVENQLLVFLTEGFPHHNEQVGSRQGGQLGSLK